MRQQGLFADERCSQAILDFITTTQVGRRVPDVTEDAAQGEASERERRRREESDEHGELGIRNWTGEECLESLSALFAGISKIEGE